MAAAACAAVNEQAGCYPTRWPVFEKESLTPGSSQERLNPQGEKHGEENRRLHQAASASW